MAAITGGTSTLLDPTARLDESGRRELLLNMHEEAERLDRIRNQQQSDVVARLGRLSGWYRALPVQDSRTPDEIIGYDEHGLPA